MKKVFFCALLTAALFSVYSVCIASEEEVFALNLLPVAFVPMIHPSEADKIKEK